ncbi:MAG: DUF1194 domain-containing protein [Pseudomonadota bacterium]
MQKLKPILVLIASLFVIALPFAPSQAQAPVPVDLELVLAVDISGSMDKDEQKLQRDGYVAALRHPDIVQAITSGYHGRIALAYLEYGGVLATNLVMDWTLLDDAASVKAAAKKLDTADIGISQGTSISTALAQAALMIDGNRFEGARRVIDISGDGPNNLGPHVLAARAEVLERGIEINGLPILIKAGQGGFQIKNLDIYYEDCVAGGPAAFVVPVLEASRLAASIRQKMMLEISGISPPKRFALSRYGGTTNAHRRVVAAGGQAVRAPRIDCLIGEKQRLQFMRSLGFD